MEMNLLTKRVEKEIEAIADKGITSSNLETANKLIDIYKDIKEIECMEEKGETFDASRRGGRGRYNRYNEYPMDDRTERYFARMKEGMSDYSEGRSRYRDGGSEARMIDGIEMTMSAVVNFVESLVDYAETSQEKEIVRKYINKMKNV